MKRIAIIAGLLVVVMLVGWYEGFYRSENSHIGALKAKEQTAQSAVLSLDSQYAALVSSEKRLPAERAALAKLNKLLPAGPDLDTLEKLLSEATTAAGVTLDSVSTPPPAGFGSQTIVAGGTAAAGPEQLMVTLGVTGSQHQLAHLYRILDTDSRLFVIDNCVLDFSAVNGRWSTAADIRSEATLNIRAFFASTNPTSAVSSSSPTA